MPKAIRRILRSRSGRRARSCLSMPMASGAYSLKTGKLVCKDLSNARALCPGVLAGCEVSLSILNRTDLIRGLVSLRLLKFDQRHKLVLERPRDPYFQCVYRDC